MRIEVNGKAFFDVLDPLASNVPTEEGWPSPTSRKVGHGRTFTYDVTPEVAELIASHMQVVGEGWAYSDDPDALASSRNLLRQAKRVRDQVSAGSGMRQFPELCDAAQCSPDFDVVYRMSPDEAIDWLTARLAARAGQTVPRADVAAAWQAWADRPRGQEHHVGSL